MILASKKLFEIQDSKFYVLLESSKWLSYVSMCLHEAVSACEHICSGVAVALQGRKKNSELLVFLLKFVLFALEGNGRDASAVVSSLVQLMLDTDCRSISGFQSLIQKEWIALGHPFSMRLGLIKDIGNEQSPIFLLFLDCVWQLQHQFPAAFEFSETYLTTVADACHNSFFDTFIFDCEKDRLNAIVNTTVNQGRCQPMA